jgi:hypothetical protein
VTVRATTRRALALAVCAAVVAVAPGAAAQDGRALAERDRAGALLERGRLVAAESIYFAATRDRPRDPWARLNLGRHLLARGAGKIAAALLEEARMFGGDPRLVAPDLVLAYERSNSWRSIAAIPNSPLTVAEQRRAEWLMSHAPASSGADSVTVPMQPGDDSEVGRVLIAIDGDPIVATIDPAVRGIVLDTGWARRSGVRVFATSATGRGGAASASGVAVATTIGFGALMLTNVPVRIAAQRSLRAVRIGLDVLGDRAATFDPTGASITLRRQPVDARVIPGARVPTLFTDDGLCVVLDGLLPLSDLRTRAMFDGRKWTVLGVKGEIAVAPR